ncbi:MAG: EAL domain-containing protein [Lachnospiraceae bacterium]|nr:EAL domain-containing protein [Ruminococcus sp.]MCM1275817.1 EAL domain-containing protein [Lachnospiraceae bacterium]
MKSVLFDVSALIMLAVLFVTVVIRKMTKGTSNRLFLLQMLLAVASTSFDIFAVTLDNYNSRNVLALNIAHMGYLIIHNIHPFVHMLFVISLTDTWHRVFRSRLKIILFFLPYGVTFTLVATNPFTHFIFTVDNGYTHEKLFHMLYICIVPYIIYNIVHIIKYRALLNRRKIFSLFSMTVLSFIAVMVHLFIQPLLVECFAITMSLFIVSAGVLRPEDYIDSFTGLYKHTAYASDMKRSFYNDKHVNIVMLNIGNYNTLTTMLGYDMMTDILNEVSATISNINARLHGRAALYFLDRGRFRMVFRERYRAEAETAASELMNELKMRSHINGLDINFTPYIVLARCPEEIESFESLMAFGNDFHEKNHYSGQVMLAPDVYDSNEFAIQNNIDKIIERALDNNKFEVYYQPIYSISERKYVSAEALLRLYDDEHGFISPEILVPAAEKSGAIHKIGEFVFEEVCKFVSSREYKALGLDYIEVNLSVAQCMHGDLADKILSVMRKYEVSPDSINLEITETAASYSQRVMTENLNKLSRAGLSFSLDDYGTGYSNMKRVIQLPLKIVKLDKSFVDDQHNPKMWIFLQNTVKMLKDMQMEIVVEGIETQEMVDAFSNLKCDFIQGYFFSRPISRAEFVEFIAGASGIALETVDE